MKKLLLALLMLAVPALGEVTVIADAGVGTTGFAILKTTDDPEAVAHDAMAGSLILYDGGWYVKDDDGLSTNVSTLGESAAAQMHNGQMVMAYNTSSIDITTVNVWQQIVHGSLTCGEVNGMTCSPTADTLTVTQAGLYWLAFSATSLDAVSGSTHFEVGVAVNGTVQSGSSGIQTFYSGSYENLTGMVQVDLLVGDEVEWYIRNRVNNQDAYVIQGSFVAFQIGG